MQRKKEVMKMAMLSDIKGRIDKFKLNKTDSFLAVLETLVNSIQSGSKNIIFEIIRESDDELLTEKEIKKIIAIKITDDGEGFTEKNYNAFRTIDTTNKYTLGGKGVGRLSWLLVFENIKISSNYIENDVFMQRNFDFKISENGIENSILEKSTDFSNKTSILLKHIKEDRYNHIPKDSEDIKKKVLDYLFIYFLDKTLDFDILLIDGLKKESLRTEFEGNYFSEVKKFSYELESQEDGVQVFDVLYYFSEVYNKNSIIFTAHKRVVEEHKFNQIDEKFEQGFLKCFISANYFDDKVTDERTGFYFTKSGRAFSLTRECIIEKLEEELKLKFQEYFEQRKIKKKEKMDNYLKIHPHYRYIVELSPDIIEGIAPTESDIEITKKLAVKEIEIEAQINESINGIKSYEEYIEKKDELEKIAKGLHSGDLVSYVMHRKTIINLYKKFLECDENGKYKSEESIHEIFFPIKKDISQIKFDEHNLWLIDDRLSFHDFIVSDVPLTQSKRTQGTKYYKRPDILTVNEPHIFQGSNNGENEVYIIEFKKPQRDDYKIGNPDDYDKNPIDQLLNYALDLKEGRVRNYKGRDIKIGEETTIFAFLIADLTDPLIKALSFHNMTMSADKQSYYHYFNNQKVFLEVHSFDKVIANAEKRNFAFFKKLGINE